MSEQLVSGMKKLDTLAYTFAKKQQLELENMIFDDGVFMFDREQHKIELHCSGKKAHVHISTDEIINYSLSAQNKMIMALMHFVA